jgi:hypothetical protein
LNKFNLIWNNYWHNRDASELSLDLFRFFFYSALAIIFCFDYYGGFFVSLSLASNELFQPTWLEVFFSFVKKDIHIYSFIRWLFVILCLVSALGMLSKFSKILSALCGLYIFNTLGSFGSWNHSLVITTLVLVLFIFVPSSFNYSLDYLFRGKSSSKPEPWMFVFIQTSVIWSYFSSGLYKILDSGFGWVTENSFYNYLLASRFIEKVTSNIALTNSLVDYPSICWWFGFSAITIELFSPIALFIRRARLFIFLTLVLFQVSIYFLLNENFIMCLPLLPALFWEQMVNRKTKQAG